MRTAIAIIFILLYGVALIRPALPLVEYYAQWEEYQTNCINKARPEIQCNGQCILMQKIKAHNNETDLPATPPAHVKVNFEDYPVGIIEHLDTNHEHFGTRRSQPADHHESFSQQHSVSDIFHPPSA